MTRKGTFYDYQAVERDINRASESNVKVALMAIREETRHARNAHQK